MAVTLTTRWVYPTSNLQTLDDPRVRRVHLLVNGVSDGTTNLSNQVVIDTSTLSLPDGAPVGRLALRRVGWSEDGFTSMSLAFDRSPDETIIQMSGVDYKDFPEYLGDVGEEGDGNGNLLLTTVGATATATFSIEIEAKLKGVKRPSYVE